MPSSASASLSTAHRAPLAQPLHAALEQCCGTGARQATAAPKLSHRLGAAGGSSYVSRSSMRRA
eukprot:scaffold596_cov236-Pinguiococcus_pyrenoidosus.AAC.2